MANKMENLLMGKKTESMCLEENKIKERESKRPNTIMVQHNFDCHDNLFEQFFIVGADLQNLNVNGSILVKPKKLFQYPNISSKDEWYVINNI